jgi:hypothetical protein
VPIRLYDSAYIVTEAAPETPVPVQRDARNPGWFIAGEGVYDIDGRPARLTPDAPAIIRVLSLSEIQAAGRSLTYNRDLPKSFT